MASAFDRLHPALQHALVHHLGWRELRPVQELALPPVLSGENVLVLAPTAGGKTEAAILPVLSGLLDRPRGQVRALYLSPLKALLNNQEPRLETLCRMVGRAAFKWHGDVSAQDKKAFMRQPAEVLMLTPESLEGFLLGRRHGFFTHIEYVVIDEIHAFAGDDRGDHLIALLERLAGLLHRDFQRLGLSATVGNPEDLLAWLCGSSRRAARTVRPPSDGLRRRIEFHPLDEDDIDAVASRLARGRRSLLFCESRSNTEKLKLVGIPQYVHHGSLSAERRLEAERAFQPGRPACILCTSTLELGLDVGDLDLVLQVAPPATVSAFLQRLGRTGRRPGTVGHMALLTDRGWGFLQAVAVVRLAVDRYVEPVVVSKRSAHIFIHQVLSRVLAERGVPRHRLVAGLGEPACFSELTSKKEILQHLIDTHVLAEVDGHLVMGDEGERRFGRRHFESLYAVFESARQLEVRTVDDRPVGHLDAYFAGGIAPGFVFFLGGQAWVVVACGQSGIKVAPAAHGQVPVWQGVLSPLSFDLCQAMRSLLLEREPVPFLHDEAQKLLDDWRDEWRPLLSTGRVVISEGEDEVTIYTFAGGRINNVYGRALQDHGRRVPRINDLWVTWRKSDADEPAEVVYESLEAVRSYGPDDLRRLSGFLPPTRLSKFQPLLPPELQGDLLAERLFDLPGAVAGLEDGVSTVYVGRCAAQ
ncbi:MAG TPA: DEAD/DEAH box helicase [Candidatus Xenobia bacterium]|jgi:ATP-dependent Lhr-like helicase